ncbi:hypothetical protein [uncultured Neptuniibacter sp.]|uniref:hypothetical protein n=1 Tax=uncultured Neptuniibacter sp. TaxID=502143 RepID=UPI0026098CD0|nr:hypothetical protein [uncultured Neptuniibacter sp.]
MTDSSNNRLYRRHNLVFILGVILLSGFMISALYLFFASSRQAENETLKLGESLSSQSTLLIRPLLLSEDRVSLNYLLNELEGISYIKGLQVQDDNRIVIARAGSSTPLKIEQQLFQQDRAIGSVTLWLNTVPIHQMLTQQLWPLTIIFLATITFALTLLYWLLNRMPEEQTTSGSKEDEQESGYELNFEETLAFQSAQQSTPSTLQERPVHAEPLAEGTTEATPPDQAPCAQTLQERQASPQPESVDKQQKGKAEDQYHTEELVDLLKPAHDTSPQMPKFEHHPEDLEPSAELNAETLVFTDTESTRAPKEAPYAPKTENPLFREQAEREEVQLDLYSFEHELELILPPQEAIYLFYIDSTTASSDNMSADDKATLLNVYHYLAKQVARIYNGEAEQLDNHDILLRFELHDDHDSHGTNALCAAMLFSLLYKGFNHSRIKGFQPVLSLQMSLARGHHNKYDLVKEEAHFLTRTTHSNELISHTALTEAPLLKEAMLKGADIRREDEDKVLLLKVTPKHQTLLQKQANHLLTKIFKK